MLVVDARERALAEVLTKDGYEYEMRVLPVGDVLFEGPSGSWIAERKRADDLASSLKNKRWHEQQTRLFTSGRAVIFIIEGDIRGTSLPHGTLLAAVVNAALRPGAHLFRTFDITETARLIPKLVEKMHAPHSIPSGVAPPPLLSKRKRDADAGVCSVRMLMCVPSISESVARKLLEHFGSIAALQRALSSDEPFPKVRLHDRVRLGKDRITRLREILTEKDKEEEDETMKKEE